jgi:general nucleoside transport system ATP-binding protein
MPIPARDLVTMMFGEPIEIANRSPLPLGDTVLSLSGVTIEERLLSLKVPELRVKAAEVIGVAGMVGSGQRTFLRGMCGLAPVTSGTVTLAGNDVTKRSYRHHLDAGMHYLPAGRLEEGLVEGLTIAEHFILADRENTGFLIDWDEADAKARSEIEEYSIKGTSVSPAEALSGGNQQRLLLAMLPDELELLLMEHPTRGLDIESADWVWTQLLARREGGTALIFSSADLDELLRYSDRILVFFSGEVLAELQADATNVDEIGHLIGGRTAETSAGGAG